MKKSEVLFKDYYKKIYTLAYRMTGNKEDANDITQETYIRAFETIENFRGESKVYTWLYRIAKNNCLRFLEKKRKTAFLSLQELTEKNNSPVSEELSEMEKSNYISQVKDGCLSGLLRCLSLQQRMAFILNVLLDLPIEYAANVIGKSDNATRILIHRAKKNIKEYLCINCSLYNSQNQCRCENLINFSLKQGWIGASPTKLKETIRIETEIGNLKKVVNLYKTLHEVKPSEDFSNHIRKLISDKKEFLILKNKKVK
jgi:RNA polymerase sigma factor (sigma-70 family)